MSAAQCVISAARDYLGRGWRPVPIQPGKKTPALKEWPQLRLEVDQVPEVFASSNNIGLLLGVPSNGLVDIDFDHPIARALAHLLPHTDRVHGRSGNPSSHRWYECTGEVPQSAKFVDPTTGEMLVEFRSTGGQTVVPPSRYIVDGANDQLSGSARASPRKSTATICLPEYQGLPR